MAPGFVLTIDSDDDGPPIPASKPSSTKKGKAATAKLSHKQQLAHANAKANKRKPKKGEKRKAFDAVSSDEEPDDDGRDVPMGDGVGEPDEGADELDKEFVFDGLGGGFVGERRNNVWDAGQHYIAARPNAIPRVTVDEIIARRAPERAMTQKAKKQKKAQQSDSEGSEQDDLEKEMLRELGGEEGSDSESGSESDGDDDDESGDSEEPTVKSSKKGKEVVQDDDEDWLKLGQKSDDEEAVEGQAESDDEIESQAEDENDEEAPTGFAALADLDDEDASEASQSEDELPVKPSPSTTDGPSAAELAASKAYFTSHTASSSAHPNGTFSTLPSCTLSRSLLLALSSLSLAVPTPIQRECIPIAMLGKDLVASSATGSGKTVAFWVGVIERLLHRDRRDPRTRVVVMCPTRELAVQVHGVGVALARYTDVQFCLCVGGLSLKVQEAELKTRPDVVVSTPGRLIDHVRNTPCFTMDAVEVLVLDEADRMLEEGFRAELEEIIQAAPRSRQTLLFSATVTESVAQLSRLSMNKPVRVKIDEMGATASGLVQEFLRVRGDKPGEAIERGFRSGERSREALLVALCTRSFNHGRTIIFFRSKAQAHRMKIVFSLYGEGLERSDELHGDLTQDQRLASLRRFREGESSFLMATDLASRGLDIKGIENVVNYEMPRSIEIYLHRVGRTARAGKKGRALTLVGEQDRKLVKLAMKHAPPESVKQRVIPPEVISQVSEELKDLEGEVKAVQREEKEEKEFRRGDMEITKGRNMIEHEDEIKSRPARTWFQTETEKKAASKAGTAEHNSKFTEKNKNGKRPAEETETKAPKRTPFSGMSRKEKRRKMAAFEDREEQESGVKQEISASIRSAKKASRPTKMTFAKPDRVPGEGQQKKKKKKDKGSVFDREIGQVGEAGSAGKKMRPSPMQRKKMAGGSAGKVKGGAGGAGGKKMGRK